MVTSALVFGTHGATVYAHPTDGHSTVLCIGRPCARGGVRLADLPAGTCDPRCSIRVARVWSVRCTPAHHNRLRAARWIVQRRAVSQFVLSEGTLVARPRVCADHLSSVQPQHAQLPRLYASVPRLRPAGVLSTVSAAAQQPLCMVPTGAALATPSARVHQTQVRRLIPWRTSRKN